MPRPTIDYLNARRALKPASGGKFYKWGGKYALEESGRLKPKPCFSIHFLRQWREWRLMSRRALADAVGLAVQTIGRIENRQIQLTQKTIDAFARALKIPRGALFHPPPAA